MLYLMLLYDCLMLYLYIISYRTFRFEQWGRYVMMWHDGRFMRHTRFRYWLLGTMLRVMSPGVQQTFSALARRARTTRWSR